MRESVAMIFGDHVEAPASAAEADWIQPACRGAWSTVGGLLPNLYPSYVRIPAPEPSVENWWRAYRDLFGVVAATGTRHTTTPEKAWFAVWEGHGFDTGTTHVAWQGQVDGATRIALEQERERLREQDMRRNHAIRAAIDRIPRLDLPHRTYFLLTGPVSAATHLQEPAHPADWRRPDLFWPQDRRWFVASDVDFWSLYIGGDEAFISDLASSVPTRAELVTLDRRLEVED